MRTFSRRSRVAVPLVAMLGLSGCAAGANTTGSVAAPTTSQTLSVTTDASAPHPTTRPTHPSHLRRPFPPNRPPNRHRGSHVYSTASNAVVQPQPAAGSCHAIGTGLYSRPDPACTPGALNPAVTQATIGRTICVDGWTETVRPSETITEPEKASSMAAYGDTGSMGNYEYDHFVPLQLGGATNDPRNLWPEPGASPNPKDTVEYDLRQEVCDGQISLAHAQREIATDWVSLARASSPPTANGPAPTSPPPQRPQCALTAAYNSTYNDYNVYVHSNQPDQTVTVTDAYGHTDTWHTDASGYADVYFRSGGSAPGRRITTRVGPAACSTTL